MCRVHAAALFTVFTVLVTGRVAPCQTLPAYHIAVSALRHVRCELELSAAGTDLQASKWLIVLPNPINSVSQSVLHQSETVDGNPVPALADYDSSNLHRPVLCSTVDVVTPDESRELDLAVVYDVLLSARHLVPGTSDSSVQPLSAVEDAEYLGSSPTTNFESQSFQRWLTAVGLRRRSGEDNLTFGRRVFEWIRYHYIYSYQPNQDRRASVICKTNATDCGGLSNLFVAVMRASGVPARLDAGRWAISSGPLDPLHQCHVKSEFYADSIGWVPIEMSGAVSDKEGAESLYFGNDSGEFLTLSVDTDYVLNIADWGTKHLFALQGACIWAYAAGSVSDFKTWDTWSITDLPVVEPESSTDLGTAAQSASMTSRGMPFFVR